MSDSHSLILFPSQYISDFKLCFCLLLDIKHFTWKAPLLGRHCWGVSEDPDAPAGLTWAVLMLSWEFRVFSVWWMWSYGGICQKNHRVSQASHWMRCFLMVFFFQFLSVKNACKSMMWKQKIEEINEIGNRRAHLSACCVTHQQWFAQSFGNMRKLDV